VAHKTLPLVAVLVLAVGVRPAPTSGAEPLPPRAVARLGSYQFYHGPGIRCAVLSPDGTRAASAAALPSYFRHVPAEDRNAYETSVVVWDAATGERVRELRLPHGPAVCLAFSADGKRLAAAYWPSVAVFDVATGKLLRELGKLEGSALHLQFSAGGKQLLVSEHMGRLTSWDVESSKRLRDWRRPTGAPDPVKPGEILRDAVPSPDGKFLAWRLWPAPDYGKVAPGFFPPPLRVAGPTILVVSDAVTEACLYRRVFKEGSLDSLTFSHDGRRFMTAAPEPAVWDAATGKELFSLDAPEAHRAALSPGGRHAVVAGGESRVWLWDLDTRKPSLELCTGLAYMNSDILEGRQSFSADGKSLLLATDSTLRVFDTTTGKERGTAAHRTHVVPRFSADGRTLFTSCDEARCGWSLVPGKEPALLSREPRHAWEGICGNQALAHSADGRLFADRRKDRIRARESATGRAVCQVECPPWAFFGLFSPDAARLLLWHPRADGHSWETAGLYDARTGRKSGEIKVADRAGYPAFSPDGRLVAWAEQGHAVRLHDAATGKLVRTLRSSQPLPEAECNDASLLFSPDGELLFVTSYRYELFAAPEDVEKWAALPTRVFHVHGGKEIVRCHINAARASRSGKLSCGACSPDGRLLAAAEEQSGIIRLVEIASGQVRAELSGHRHGVRGLAFSPDGKTLASGGEDSVAYLWDVTGARAAAGPAGERELAGWWADLAAEDARRAGAALASLVRTPGPSVAFLKSKLRPAEAPDEKRLARLLADLDANEFAAREAASHDLARLGEQAEAALRRALKGSPSPEVTRRIKELLDKVERGPLAPETLRALRAVEALEQVGTPEARRCLEALAKGAPEDRQTRDAKAALGRLGSRR
jgi:WD40 repeat protein